MPSDHLSRWQRAQPVRYVAGRRSPSPTEHERQRLAHEAESEAHQADSGGLDWFTTISKKNPTKAKQLQQTTPHPSPLQSCDAKQNPRDCKELHD